MASDTRDRVILRRWPEGDIIALFPDMVEDDRHPLRVNSYMHVGQHSEADYGHVVRQTAPVPSFPRPADARDLLDELEAIGYRPMQCQRRPRRRLED